MCRIEELGFEHLDTVRPYTKEEREEVNQRWHNDTLTEEFCKEMHDSITIGKGKPRPSK